MPKLVQTGDGDGVAGLRAVDAGDAGGQPTHAQVFSRVRRTLLQALEVVGLVWLACPDVRITHPQKRRLVLALSLRDASPRFVLEEKLACHKKIKNKSKVETRLAGNRFAA